MYWKIAGAIPILIVLFSTPNGNAGELPSYSWNNYIRYGDGSEELYDLSRQKNYLEEEAELQLSWRQALLGLRYDYDHPAEFTPSRNTIRKYYLDYRLGNWNFRGGTFSDLFGRGMSFNTYEEKTIGHDSEISGLRATWLTNDTELHIVGGRLAYEHIPDFTQTVDLDVGGIHIQHRVTGKFFFGGGYVQSEITQNPGYYRDTFSLSIAEVTGEYRGESLQAYTSVASNENGSNRLFRKGNISTYSGFSFSHGPLSLSLEYKNYRFGIAPPNVSSQSLRHRRLMPFQNPPSGVREYGWVFLSRRSSGVDFNDEVGFLLDINYAVRPKTTLNLSGSLAGKHYGYERISGKFRRIDHGVSWLPSTRKEQSPYWQAYSDIEHFFPNGSSFTLGTAYTFENNFNSYYPDWKETIKMATVPFHTQIVLSSRYAAQCSAEYQYFQETQYSANWYGNGILTLGFSRSPSLDVSLVAEWLEGNANFSNKKTWVYGSIGIRIRSQQTIEFGYGETRGGMNCTNGLCRYVEPFRGFRLTATLHH